MDRLRFAMSQRIIRTVDREQTIAALAEDIQQIGKVSRNRAILIATDQVGKLNSQLTHYRQFNAGIEEYVWNTMKDSRVRPEHAAREWEKSKKKFKWSEPPADGHPGWAIRCRCTALPVYDTDKMGVEPNKKTYLSIPERTVQSQPTSEFISNITDNGTTDTMKALFAAGKDSKIYQIDTSFEKPFGFDPSSRKVLVNPTHKNIKDYNLFDAIAHETIHWLDNSMGWSKLLGKQIDEAIQKAEEFVLSKENAEAYKKALSGVFKDHMSVSDIFSNITRNNLYGNVGHKDYYWASNANKRKELIADILTIFTTNDEIAEKFILDIQPLEGIYKELVRRYGKFIRRYKSLDTGSKETVSK